MRRRSRVWLVAVAHALTPPTGLRKLTRSVASPDLLQQNDAVTFLQETGVPTFAADEAWLELDDAAPSTVVKPVDGADVHSCIGTPSLIFKNSNFYVSVSLSVYSRILTSPVSADKKWKESV